MRLERDDGFFVDGLDKEGEVHLGSYGALWGCLSSDDLRWLCLVAGPALLNELGKEASDGND